MSGPARRHAHKAQDEHSRQGIKCASIGVMSGPARRHAQEAHDEHSSLAAHYKLEAEQLRARCDECAEEKAQLEGDFFTKVLHSPAASSPWLLNASWGTSMHMWGGVQGARSMRLQAVRGPVHGVRGRAHRVTGWLPARMRALCGAVCSGPEPEEAADAGAARPVRGAGAAATRGPGGVPCLLPLRKPHAASCPDPWHCPCFASPDSDSVRSFRKQSTAWWCCCAQPLSAAWDLPNLARACSGAHLCITASCAAGRVTRSRRTREVKGEGAGLRRRAMRR